MDLIRQARESDVSRIAEIRVLNNRINFYPIFGDEAYSFGEVQVLPLAQELLDHRELLERIYVYDDGVIRGMISVNGEEIEKLFVDPFFQNRGIGAKLLRYAIENHGAKWLWVLEKNVRAIRFYRRYGFEMTDEKVFEEGTTEFLVRLRREVLESE